MKAYAAIFNSRFQTLLQYRAVAAAGIATQLFWGLVRMMIFDAFYRSSIGVQPLTHGQAVTYIWLGQAMLLLTMIGVDTDVASMIRSGNIAYEMTRPLDIYALWYARALSGRAAPLLMRSLPIVAVAALFFGLGAPVSPAAAGMFLISAMGGLLTAAALITLLTTSLLWTVSGEGISRLGPGVVYVFSGVLIPIPLLPDSIQRLAEVLPFRGLLDTPLRIYFGEMHGEAALAALIMQFGWIVVLIVLGRMAVARGLRRLVAQGG